MKYYIVCNPTAGMGNAKKSIKKVEAFFASKKIKYYFFETKYVGHATEIVAKISNSSELKTIISMGGDGTLHEVINGIKNFKTTQIAILPCGSGNDFVKNIGFHNLDINAALNAILKNTIHCVNYILINNLHRAINMVGFGLEAEVTYAYDQMKWFTPFIRYKVATIKKAIFYSLSDYEILIDKKETRNICGLLLSIGNGYCCGDGIILAPWAKIDDDLLTVWYLNKFNRIKITPYLKKVLIGDFVKIKETSHFTCKELKVTQKKKLYESDGFVFNDTNVVNIKIAPEKIKMIVNELELKDDYIK